MYTDKFPNCWFAVLRSIRPKRELDRGIDEDRAMLHRCFQVQKSAKNVIQKICEIDELYLCLQQFDKYGAHEITGNGNQVNLLKFTWKSS